MAFEVIPAIDLLGRRVVQLAQGDYDRASDYGGDPGAVARGYREAGSAAHPRGGSGRGPKWPARERRVHPRHRRGRRRRPGAARRRRAKPRGDRRSVGAGRLPGDPGHRGLARSAAGARGVTAPARPHRGGHRRPGRARGRGGLARDQRRRGHRTGAPPSRAPAWPPWCTRTSPGTGSSPVPT